MRLRLFIISLLLLTVGLAHWLMPIDQPFFHGVHVAMRKMFILPIVLAAIWFNLRGAVLSAVAMTVVYVPHVFWQWAGHASENLNQAGEVLTLWVLALLSGWLVGREKNVLQQLARSHHGTMLALVAALDAREHDTEVHSLRVQAYVLRIARELDISGKELRALAMGAILHDVGKIGVPDQILLKPGPLDEEEWQVMRRHPEIGRHILRSMPFLERASEIVHAHHERYDGSGYPRGLAGPQIPMTARIFAVADAFDAMTSDRPYKKAVGIDEARRRIEADSGSHFDPTVAQAFLGVTVSEWRRIAQRFDQPPESRDAPNLLSVPAFDPALIQP